MWVSHSVQVDGVTSAMSLVTDNGGASSRRRAPNESSTPVFKRRTRASMACRLCRNRKTRCDNQRPSCGYCSMHGATCLYPDDPADGIETADVSNSAILDKVNHAVALLQDIKRDRQVPLPTGQNAQLQAPGPPGDFASQPSCPAPSHTNITRGESAFADDGFGHLDVSDFAVRESACESILRWPVLQSLGVGSGIKSLGLEAVALREVNEGLRQGAIPQDGLLGLCQRFLALVHIKNPILDVPDFVQQARNAAEYGPGWDAGGCLVLIACALASVAVPYSSETGGYDRQASMEEMTSAEMYFGAAQRRLGLLSPSLVAVQCQYLAGLYAKFVVRPVTAWTLLQSACTQLQAFLYAKGLMPADGERHKDASRTRHIEQRLYWSCVKAEWELRIELQLPSTGRFKYPDLFPSLSFPASSELQPLDSLSQEGTPAQGLTPWSPAAWQSSPGPSTQPPSSESALQPEEERSWLYYLAEISLRGLMNRVLTGLYNGGSDSWKHLGEAMAGRQVAYTEELEQWHAALPQQLKFIVPLPRQPTRDLVSRPSNELSFFLQTRYAGVLEWIYRPSLYIILQGGDVAGGASHHVLMASKAVDAAAVLIMLVATHHRHGGIWGLVRRSFGASLCLIAAAVHCHRASRRTGAGALYVSPPGNWVQLVELSMMTARQWGKADTPDLLKMGGILERSLSSAVAEINNF